MFVGCAFGDGKEGVGVLVALGLDEGVGFWVDTGGVANAVGLLFELATGGGLCDFVGTAVEIGAGGVATTTGEGFGVEASRGLEDSVGTSLGVEVEIGAGGVGIMTGAGFGLEGTSGLDDSLGIGIPVAVELGVRGVASTTAVGVVTTPGVMVRPPKRIAPAITSVMTIRIPARIVPITRARFGEDETGGAPGSGGGPEVARGRTGVSGVRSVPAMFSFNAFQKSWQLPYVASPETQACRRISFVL